MGRRCREFGVGRELFRVGSELGMVRVDVAQQLDVIRRVRWLAAALGVPPGQVLGQLEMLGVRQQPDQRPVEVDQQQRYPGQRRVPSGRGGQIGHSSSLRVDPSRRV